MPLFHRIKNANTKCETREHKLRVSNWASWELQKECQSPQLFYRMQNAKYKVRNARAQITRLELGQFETPKRVPKTAAFLPSTKYIFFTPLPHSPAANKKKGKGKMFTKKRKLELTIPPKYKLQKYLYFSAPVASCDLPFRSFLFSFKGNHT